MSIGLGQLNALTRLNEFRDAALSAGNDKAVIHAGSDRGKRVYSVATDDKIRGVFTWKASGRDIAANNATRSSFKMALLELFDRKSVDQLPKAVRNVLKSADFDGKGKPLSARRIRAVMTAVANTDAFKAAQHVMNASLTVCNPSFVHNADDHALSTKAQWRGMEGKISAADTSSAEASILFDAAFGACRKFLDQVPDVRDANPAELFGKEPLQKANDDHPGIKNFVAQLDGWKFKDGVQKAAFVEIAKCLPDDLLALMNPTAQHNAVLMPRVVKFVAFAAYKIGILKGPECPRPDFASQTPAGQEFKPTLSKSEIKAFQLDAAFKKNKTAEFKKGVCAAATSLWLARHIKGGDPLALRPEDCNDLQRRVESTGDNGYTNYEPAKVLEVTGGTIETGNNDFMAPLKLDRKLNVNLGQMLDDLPPKGFVFLAAEKGSYAHSMAIFKESDDRIHFFNPGGGMYMADSKTMTDIIAHNLSGWTQVTCQPGHVE